MKQYISLIGINDLEKVDIYFASQMVDVAYVVEMSGDLVKVVPESDGGIDLSNEDDSEWLVGIITQALVECNEAQAKIEIRTMP